MATTITPETVGFVRESLVKHGFEHALKRASVDAISAGMDADDFTYSVVSLFITYILQKAMESHGLPGQGDPHAKFVTLQGNTKAFLTVVRAVAQQLAKQLDEDMEALKPLQGAGDESLGDEQVKH